MYPNWLEFMVINFLRKHNSYSGLPRQKLCSRTFQMKYSSRLGYTLNNAGISKSTRGGGPLAAPFITRYTYTHGRLLWTVVCLDKVTITRLL